MHHLAVVHLLSNNEKHVNTGVGSIGKVAYSKIKDEKTDLRQIIHK